MKRISVIILALIILILPCAGLYGCSQKVYANDLMANITPNTVVGKNADEAFISNQMRLSLELFREVGKKHGGNNHMISPLSIQLALAMTANGAKGNTKTELEELLSGSISLDELNKYLYSYVSSLPSGEKYEVTHANSIWLRDTDELSVKEEFLQKNADYYGAGAYKAPFDKTTVNDINRWVEDNTKGMIKKVVDNISSTAMLYLINTLTFEAEWASPYYKTSIKNGTFHSPSGEQSADMMYSSESEYIELENATGFVKDYSGHKYLFIALLPNEGTTPEELITSLDSESLLHAINNTSYCAVNTVMPSFKTDFSADIKEQISALGVNDAFSLEADFSDMATHPDGLFISSIVHKTHITVDAKGTKAGAITIVEAKAGSVAPSETKSVILDRPFVYMIIDSATSLSLFIGILNSVK